MSNGCHFLGLFDWQRKQILVIEMKEREQASTRRVQATRTMSLKPQSKDCSRFLHTKEGRIDKEICKHSSVAPRKLSPTCEGDREPSTKKEAVDPLDLIPHHHHQSSSYEGRVDLDESEQHQQQQQQKQQDAASVSNLASLVSEESAASLASAFELSRSDVMAARALLMTFPFSFFDFEQ